MAEKSTFFNSVNGDRKYKSEDIAAHFAKLITNGVYPSGTQLQATENEGMDVTVSAGSAWINGYAYHNDSDYTLSFDAADGVLNRIDRIVVRWGRLARSINLAIIKGTPASSPTAPAIVRSSDYYDLGIANVSIGAGITAITQAMITDTRADNAVCGFVSSLIQPDTSGWFSQFDTAFNAWFAGVQDTLDGDTAGNLLTLINGVDTSLDAHTADYEYQTPTIVGTQIQLQKQSDTNILKFKLDSDLSGGAITISLDSGTTSKPLVDIEENAVTELSKGFVEVVEDAVNFTLAPKGGMKRIDNTLIITAQSDSYNSYIYAINCDSNYIYAGGVGEGHNVVWKLDKLDLKKIYESSAIDTIYSIVNDNNYVYAGTTTGYIVKLIKNNMGTQMTSSQYDGSNDVYCLLEDGDYLYASINGKILKINKSNLVKASQSASLGDAIYGLAEDTNYLYAAGSSQKIYILDKSTLTTIGESSVLGASILGLAMDDNYIYTVGASDTIRKYNKSNLTLVGESADMDANKAIAVDDRYLYATKSTGSYRTVQKIDKNTLVHVANAASQGDSIVNALAIDDNNIYFGGQQNRVVRASKYYYQSKQAKLYPIGSV